MEIKIIKIKNCIYDIAEIEKYWCDYYYNVKK